VNRGYLIHKISYAIEARKTPVLDFQGQLDKDEQENHVDETPT